jgi:hypothetical protein
MALLSCSKKEPCPTCPQPPTDSTSHNFIWTTQTLGDGASSVLNDVAIINDTLAYAVGAIYLKDSLGNWDPFPYNLAKWNGQTWILQKVPYYYQGQSYYSPIRTLLAFNSNDIWFAGQIHWNGQTFNSVELPSSVWGPYHVNKMWGTSDANIYIVGDGGSIAHYNGSSWTKIESGTTLNVYDVFGSGGNVYAVAADLFVNNDHKVFRVNANGVVALPDNGIPQSIYSVWVDPWKYSFIVGDGIYSKTSIESSEQWNRLDNGVTSFYLYRIRGTSRNDVIACGAYGEVLHYNGVSWASFRNTTSIVNGAYYGIDVRGNLAVLVGMDNPRAIVAIGRR